MDGQTDGQTKYCNPRCACAPSGEGYALSSAFHSPLLCLATSLPFGCKVSVNLTMKLLVIMFLILFVVLLWIGQDHKAHMQTLTWDDSEPADYERSCW